jgi:hypothetical protein
MDKSHKYHQSDLILEWVCSLKNPMIFPQNVNSEEEADKAARDFAASVASAYKLATSKITLSDINKDIPAL